MAVQPHGTWVIRRRFMIAVIGFCMGVIIWSLDSGRTDAIVDTALTMSFSIIGMTVGSYVFGAAWEKNKTVNPKPQGKP